MNFTLSLLFFFRSQPGTFALPVLLVLAVLFPAQAGALATDGPRHSCSAAAAGTAVATLTPAGSQLRSARAGQASLPAQRVCGAGFGVTELAAAARRGTRGGICRDFATDDGRELRTNTGPRARGNGAHFSRRSDSAGRTLVPTAQLAEASMKELSAVTNRRRISAALPYHNQGTAVFPAAVPATLDLPIKTNHAAQGACKRAAMAVSAANRQERHV